jgi:hypothetical protein
VAARSSSLSESAGAGAEAPPCHLLPPPPSRTGSPSWPAAAAAAGPEGTCRCCRCCCCWSSAGGSHFERGAAELAAAGVVAAARCVSCTARPCSLLSSCSSHFDLGPLACSSTTAPQADVGLAATLAGASAAAAAPPRSSLCWSACRASRRATWPVRPPLRLMPFLRQRTSSSSSASAASSAARSASGGAEEASVLRRKVACRRSKREGGGLRGAGELNGHGMAPAALWCVEV